MKKYLPLLLAIVFALSACGSTPPDNSTPTPDMMVGTIVAQTMQAMNPTAVPPELPVQSGDQFQFKNITFNLPAGLATGASGETVARVDATSDGPTWGVAPEYTLITLQGYATGDRFHKPQIFIYPADEYAKMNENAARAVNDLRTILPGTAPLQGEMPHLPPFEAQQMFASHMQLVNFHSGRGVRYITMYSQAYIPVNNNELFYTFQALTRDNKYYISVQLPITASLLEAITAPDVNAPGFTGEQWSTYLQDITKTLNSMDSSFFSPTLDALDAFVQSIAIAP